MKENTKTKINKLVTLRRVVIVAFALSVLWLVAFIVWENLNAHMSADPSIDIQRSIKEQQEQGISF